MSRFQPSRASPPLRSQVKSTSAAAPNLQSDTRSTGLSVPELIALAPEDIEFLDAVIQRASPSAANFLTVFKAYNEILQERGLDPQDEVVYYGKLLKLGTLKGRNWGEKWDMVKQQQIPQTRVTARPIQHRNIEPPPPRPSPSKATVLTRLTGTLKALEKEDDDAYTIHSHQDDAASEADTETETETESQYATPRAVHSATPPTYSTPMNSLGLTTGPPSTSFSRSSLLPTSSKRTVASQRLSAWEAASDTTAAPSTILPSYVAATRQTPSQFTSGSSGQRLSYAPLRALAQAHQKTTSQSISAVVPTSQPVADSARAAVLKARERKGSVINEEDAWKKIQMEKDEELADEFREEKLIERCWEVWKRGYHWIVDTNAQIAEARDHLIVRLALHRWRSLVASQIELQERVGKLSDNRRLKLALQVWRTKLKEKKQAEWRQDMRARMKLVREKHSLMVKRECWVKWQNAHRGLAAEQHYSAQLLARVLRQWKMKLSQLDHLDAAADQVMEIRGKAGLARCWSMWRRAGEMRKAERFTTERAGLRVVANALQIWRKRLSQRQAVDAFYNNVVLKRAFRSWKASRDRIKGLEVRANKHIIRQNDVLLRAVMRVWKAHERGKLLERVKSVRLLRQAWDTWMRQLQYHRNQENLAVTFSMRAKSALAVSCLQKWRRVHASHLNAELFAAQYHSSQLRYQKLLTWRVQLRAKLKLNKQARIAEKYFVLRGAWKKWAAKIAEKKREKKVKEFEKKLVKRYFGDWIQRAQVERQQKMSDEIIRQRVALRIMTTALNHWTTRVADIKFRELETSQRYDQMIVSTAFKKWKTLCIRHVEELSLMESYQDVKREEMMRRMFYRWLTTARKARNRRLLLQQKEEEMKLTVIAAAWDKWRERYLDIRLQPMGDTFLIQSQQNLIFRAFGIWHSKTKSLPAVRFHAQHIKQRVWKIWRDAMPRALQAKEARETHQRAVLVKAFSKWLQAYKTKIELKAVARARYLRLPTAVPRGPSSQPRSIQPPRPTTNTSHLRVPHRSTSPISERGKPSLAPSPSIRSSVPAKPFQGRLGIASLLSERSRSPERSERFARSKRSFAPSVGKLSTRAPPSRDPSPARSTSTYGGATRQTEPLPRSPAPPSTAGGEIGRSKLWQELRGLQLRSRVKLESVRSLEPS